MHTTSKRRLLAVAATALLAALATGATVIGAAHAQSGSRLCGVSWRASDTGEHLIRLYEVPKNNEKILGVCTQAAKPGGGVGVGSPFSTKGKLWSHEQIHMLKCERFPSRWLDDRPFTFVGNNWPMPHDTADICRNTNRSDTLFEMEAYFLYDDGSHQQYQFQRG